MPGDALERITLRLSGYLGPHTARVAVKTFAAGAPRDPADPRFADAAAVLQALRPMLRTLLGRHRAEELVLELEREL